MGDLSEFFKKGFQDLKKQAIERNAQKALKVRMEEFNQARRQTRSSLMFQKRKIDEKNMTPYNTPDTEKPTKKLIKLNETLEHKSNKRLEMLHKWKTARAKKKEEEKKISKPVFKVYHIPINVGLPNLETVNKEIKGKLINTSKFAPENHVFKPPVNIKPIHFANETTKLKNNALDSSRKNKKDIKVQVKPNLVSNSQLLQRSGSIKVELTQLKSNKLTGTKEAEVGRLYNNKSFEKGPKKEYENKSNQSNNKLDMLKFRNTLNGIKEDIASLDDSKTLGKKSRKRGYIDQDVQKSTERKENPLKSSKTPQFPSSAENRGSASTKQKEKLEANKIKNKSRVTKINLKESTNVRILRSHADTANNDKDKNNELLNSSYKTANKKKQKVPHNEVSSVNTKTSLKSNGTPQKTQTPISADKQGPPSTNEKGNFESNKIQNKSRSVVVHQKETTNIRVLRSHKDPTSNHDQDKNTELLNSSCETPKKGNKGKVLLNEVSSAKRTTQNLDILYSDDEITLKTPRKTPTKTPLNISRKTPLKKQTPENIKLLSDITKSNPTETVSSSKIYISPFVTVSRGKESARKEYKIRQSTGGSLPDTPDFGKSLSKATSPNAGADYFSNKLDNEIDRIQQLCDDWLHYREAEIPEDVKDLIDVAIGQSKLLMAKKFCQFKNLITECRDYINKERPVTCMDLHGFWDTMYMQVEDINKRFNNLEVLKANNWQAFILENKSKAKNIKNKPARQTKVKASSKIKDMIKLARARKEKEVNDGDNMESGKSKIQETSSDVSNRRSTRLSILQTEQVNKRLSSPGLTMMKITQAIKQGDGITPNSILKTNSKKSEKRMTKCVLFKDLEEASNKKDVFEIKLDKKNSSDNSVQYDVQCSPLVPKRQSQRLSENL